MSAAKPVRGQRTEKNKAPKRVKAKVNPMDKKPKTTASKKAKKPTKKVAGAGSFYGATKNTKNKSG